MSWNVWWRFGPRWRDRQPLIADVVAGVGPDLLGLQETWRDGEVTQAGLLAVPLGMHSAFMLNPPIDVPENVDQVGVDAGVGLVSRWPVSRLDAHPLPARHSEPPIALVATLDHPHGALHAVVASTVLDPDDLADQLDALAVLLGDPAFDGPLPVILLADLNAPADHPGMARLLAAGTDLWTAGGGDPDAVTLSSAHPEAPLEAVAQIDRRIDHLVARAGRPGGEVTARGSRLAGHRPTAGLYPSDHFAVVTDLLA